MTLTPSPPQCYHFVVTCNIPLSSLILVAIGLDRYFCICHPFLHVITVTRTKVIIVVLALLSALMGVVPALSHSVYHYLPRLVNETVPLSHLQSGPYVSYFVLPPSSSSSSSSSSSPSGGAPLVSIVPEGIDPDSNPTPPESSSDATLLYTDGLNVKPSQDFLDEYNSNNLGPNSGGSGYSVSYKTVTGPSQSGGDDIIQQGNGGGGREGSPGRKRDGPTTPSIPSPKAQRYLSVDDVDLVNQIQRDALGNDSRSSDEIMVVVTRNLTVFEYNPVCKLTFRSVNIEFFYPYQLTYASMFLVEFIILAFLYALIYRSILQRRAWKAKRRQKSGYAAASAAPTTNCHDTEETQLTNINGNNAAGEEDARTNAGASPAPKKSQGRISAAMRDRTLYANVRTAAMLFVVTVFFVVSFLPSWLMGLAVLPFNVTVFYMFYVNSVINPFIYAFMNKSFRDDLVQLIKGCVRH